MTDATQDISVDNLEDELEATGEYNLSNMTDAPDEEIRDLDDVDEDEEEDEEDDEESLSGKDKILAKLKAQLPALAKLIPGKFKNKSIDEDDEESEEEGNTDPTKTEVAQSDNEDDDEPEWMKKIKAKAPFLEGALGKISSLQKKKKVKSDDEDSDDDDDDDDDEGEAKPKRKIKIVHIIIVAIGVGALLLTEEEQPVSNPKVVKKAEKAPRKQADPTPPAVENRDEKVVEKPAVEKPTVEESGAEKPVVEKTEVETAATTNNEANSNDDLDLGDIAQKPDLTMNSEGEVKNEKVNKVDNELDDLFAEEETKDQNTDIANTETEKAEAETESNEEATETNESEESTEEVEVSSGEEVNVDSSVDSMIGEESSEVGNKEESESEKSEDDLLLGEVKEDELINANNENSKITADILEKLEVKTKELREKEFLKKATSPTDPPEYISTGTALVYNCIDGHWACIDYTNYQICQSNYAWNLKQGITIQCYPSQIYETEEDCIALQQYKIDSVAKTPFCN